MANCDKYISVCGGNAILSSCFGGMTVIYVTQGRELRPNYFSDESYFHQLSKSRIMPIFDVVDDMKFIDSLIRTIPEQQQQEHSSQQHHHHHHHHHHGAGGDLAHSYHANTSNKKYVQ